MSTQSTVELPSTVTDEAVQTGRSLSVGDDPRFIGRFRVLRKLGEGGMGKVYEAEDPELRRRVAVKLIAGTSSEAAVARLRREAQSLAAISHPNVVTVHEVGVHEGAMFVAMEYVQGVTLRDWLAKDFRSWRDVLRVFVQAAKGLEAAHDDGLVHRDFKPDNVMIGDDERVRVLDFGIAKAVSAATSDEDMFDPDATMDPSLAYVAGANGPSPVEDSTALTRTGLVMGTPRYMAPEQFDGRNVDGRTDQFAFCVALYEALFRLRPYGGDTMLALAEAVSEGAIRPIPPDHPVPHPLRQVVLRGLSPDPEDRFPNMTVLRGALEASLRAGGAPLATRTAPREVSGGAFILSAVAVVAVVLGLAIGVRLLWPQSSNEALPQSTQSPGTNLSNASSHDGGANVLVRPEPPAKPGAEEPEPLVSPPFSVSNQPPPPPRPAPGPPPSVPGNAQGVPAGYPPPPPPPPPPAGYPPPPRPSAPANAPAPSR